MEKNKVYGKEGELKATLEDATDLVNFLRDSYGCLFIGSLTQSFAYQFLPGLVSMESVKVLASQKGKPLLVRVQCGHGSRWISTCEVWGETPEPELIERMWEIYEHAGCGFAPSPSSIGAKSMYKVWDITHSRKHTAPSLACEVFLHANSTGSPVWYPGIGHYNTIQYMDMRAAFLKHYIIHPDGTAVRVIDGYVEGLATYFVKCKVTVYNELALGPFPMKSKIGHKAKVVYPTLPGVYDDIYLWKEQVEDCERAGCSVQVSHGFGWKSFTSDNLPWARWAYALRATAPSKHVKEKSKGIGVSGIGHHGMKRERNYLVDESRSGPTDIPVLTEDGEALSYYVHSEVDNHSAYMVHWQKYTEMKCKQAMYHFALPYAIQGRLISIDFDAIMVLEGDDKHQYIRKYSVEDAACPPGSWLWQLLHNVEVIKDRTFSSDEMTRKPGVKKDVEPVY